MSSILDTAIAGINAMTILINNTTDKINHPAENNIEKRIFLENTIQEDSGLNTTVKVKEIYDNYNDFITEEKRKTNVKVQDEQTKIEQLLKLEDLLCEKSNIFNELINSLYEQIENDVINKNNIINKNIKEKSNKIIYALQDFDRKLKFLEKDIKESVINKIKKVNTLIDEIHDATIDIRYFPVLKLPNRIQSFIDKRDNLVDELNDLIGVKVVKGDDSYKVYLNNGICIIDNNHKQNLIALTSKSDDKYISVGYLDNNERRVKKIEDMIPSASLGALLKFRKEELAHARNKIGQLTVDFADSINSYNILEHDVFGHIGKQFFNISNPEIIASSTNHSSPITSAKWVSTSNSKDTDYIIYFKNNNWSVKRLSDNSFVQPNIHQENNNLLITFDGIEFVIQGKNDDGDIYMIKPYSKTLEKLELLIDENEPFSFSSNNKIDYKNNNFTTQIKKRHKNILVNNNETLDESYQKFSKSIAYKCNLLEEELPFKKNMIRILSDKKISMSNDPERDYLDLNYEQECYLANVKVLQTAERIFNEIIDCYS